MPNGCLHQRRTRQKQAASVRQKRLADVTTRIIVGTATCGISAGAKAVVHHILVYVREPGKRNERTDGIGDGLLVAYAPGDLPAIFAPGMAKKIPKGSVIVFQMHYTPNGEEQTDQSSVGLIFANMGLALKMQGEPILTPAIYSAIVVMVIVTTMITPPALKMSLSRSTG